MALIKQAGFTGAAANTMYGIVMAESGGNIHAHNTNAGTGDNSYGLAQINMLGSMGPARLAQYGLKSNDDLFDPLTNLKVAYKMSGGGTHFGDWTTYTSGAYLKAAPGATVTDSGGGGGQPASAMSANASVLSTKPTDSEYKNALGTIGQILAKIPDLNKLLGQALKEGWTTDKLHDAVVGSTWYKTHGDAARQQIALQLSDPATFNQNVKNQSATLQSMAVKMGVTLNAKDLQALSTQSLSGNWTQDQERTQIASHFDRGGKLGGEAAQVHDQLMQTAALYGQAAGWTDFQTRYRTQQVLLGKQTVDGYTESMKTAAKAMYPGLIHQIDSGLTVQDVAQPYIQSMANLLEINPATVDLNNITIKQALQGTGTVPKGGVPVAKPLTQFEQDVRKDPRWALTKNAHQQTSDMLMKIGQDWGYEA